MPEIGATLREARMRAGIDVEEVEARTKIRAKYLRAMENDEWDLLPGPVFARSFLRTYAGFLGLDSRMLVEQYRRQHERPAEHDLRPAHTREREPMRRGPRLPSWAVIGLVLVAIVVALVIIGSRNNKATTTTVGTTAGRHHHRHRPRPHRSAPPPPTTVKLQLVPTGPVYVCLVNGAGTKLINEQTFTTGQTIPTEVAPKLLLTLGTNNVHMTVNGRVIPVPASATAIRYLLEPTGVHPTAFATLPTCP